MSHQIELFTQIPAENQISYFDPQGLFSDAVRDAYNIDDPLERNRRVKMVLAHQVELIRRRNRKRGSGTSTVRRFSEMVDTLIRIMVDDIELNMEASHKLIAVVAVGGYGRMELCPKSDIDILILTSEKLTQNEKDQAEELVRNLWDFGFEVGHSVRSVSQCKDALSNDPDTWTSFLNERFLGGRYELYRQFLNLFEKRVSARKINSLIALKLAERENRLKKYGGLIQKLEPNLKEGGGCLREVHTLLWIARLKYNCRGLDDMVREGLILPQDLEDVRAAYSYLLQARCCLHFITNKKDDLLAFHLQESVSAEFGFKPQDGLKPVEVFLKFFYRHTKAVNRVAEAFLSRWEFSKSKKKYPSFEHPLFTEINGTLELKGHGANPFKNNIALMLEFFDVVNRTGLAFGNYALLRIRQAVRAYDGAPANGKEYAEVFLELCKRPKRVGRMLRFMHDVGLVELIIPDFQLINCHPQHNMYHIYTTDEHTLSVVRQLAYLPESKDPRLKTLKEAHSQITDMNVLILACFFHDIAKAVPGDHSENGAKLITQYMTEAGYSREQCEEGARLVLYHLAMNEIAQRRNLEEPKTIQDFIDQIKTLETLKKLYVLTYCDISSVHPDAWSGWKASLLDTLYYKTLAALTSREEDEMSSQEKIRGMLDQVEDKTKRSQLEQHLRQMPVAYVAVTTLEESLLNLSMIEKLKGKKYTLSLEEKGTHLDFTVVAKDNLYLLTCICGALASLNLSILKAAIFTRIDGIALDSFKLDTALPKSMDLAKVQQEIDRQLGQFLKQAKQGLPDLKLRSGAKASTDSMHVNPKVTCDNTKAENYTVVDIFCPDRIGLMYIVSKTMMRLNLNVHSAVLTTETNVAMDAFYVTDLNGGKLDETNMRLIESTLEKELIVDS